MKIFDYKSGFAHIRFTLPRKTYYNSFKIDTGAIVTVLPKSEFRHFFSSKKITDGEKMNLGSASGNNMVGYVHKVILRFVDHNENKIVHICFYDGIRPLLGMDIIKKLFVNFFSS